MTYLITTASFPTSSWLHWTQRQKQWAAIFNMAGQEDPVQREIHQDWANREYIEVITSSIKKIADFLNSFGKNFFFYRIFDGYAYCSIKFGYSVLYHVG